MESIKKFFSFFSGKNNIKNTDSQASGQKEADVLKLVRPLFGKVKVLDLEIRESKRGKINFFDIKTFQKINKIITSDLDFLKVSQTVVDAIRKELGYVAGTLFLVEKERGAEYPYIISTDIIKKLEVIFGKPTSSHVGQLVIEDNFAVKCISTKKAYVGNDLRDFVSPVLSYGKARLIQKMFRMNTTAIIPLIVKDQVIGSLMVNSSRKEMSKDERVLLSLFSDQIAIALNNAILYKNINDKIRALQEKTQDMQSLLSLSQISSSGPEIETNIQAMMDMVPEKLGYLEILGAVLVRYDEKIGKVYAYITTESDLVQRAKKILSKPVLNDYAVFVAKDGENSQNLTLTSQSILSGEIKRGENLADFVSPPLERSKAWLMQKMMGGKSFVAMPINIRGEKLGAVIFMFKKPLPQIGDRDIDILKAFSQQIGVIMENLQFYQSLNKNIEELTRTKDNLEEILTMKNEFLRIVSHQLRTPLTAVRGLISMWKDGDFDNLASVKMSEVKTRVANNIERLNNIINDMIKAMESEGDLKLKFAPTSIERILKNSVGILKSNFERKGLYIKYKKFIKEIPEIEADEKSLNHVFINLIDNAEKYTERGGLEITVYREEDNVYVRLSDTGVGLSDEDKEALFKKFSRGQDSGRLNPGGSGLGLFIVKQILDEHHGKIKVSSLERGKGTTFVVSLPVKQPKPDLRV
ncbi:GAF domain-containing sensor histidine kinase [Patescibacteria group bacterium]|nr:GAF domain-containing sensor histidine kinase [Patescibacteria group bacterium]